MPHYSLYIYTYTHTQTETYIYVHTRLVGLESVDAVGSCTKGCGKQGGRREPGNSHAPRGQCGAGIRLGGNPEMQTVCSRQGIQGTQRTRIANKVERARLASHPCPPTAAQILHEGKMWGNLKEP